MALQDIRRGGLGQKVLVVTTTYAARMVWGQEINKWEQTSTLTHTLLWGKDKFENLQKEVDVYIINYEGLKWLIDWQKVKSKLTGKAKIIVDTKKFKAYGFDTIIWDELSKLKNVNTDRFRAIKQIVSLFQTRWGLTATPAPRHLENLFGECYALDEGACLGKYVTHFRNKYMTLGFNGYDWNLRDGAEEQIYEAVKPLMLRLEGEGSAKKPELAYNHIKFELPDKIFKLYKQLEDDMYTTIRGEGVSAPTAAAAQIKCLQVCNGALYKNDIHTDDLEKLIARALRSRGVREWFDLHDAKLDALEDLVDGLQGQPLLLAYVFNHDLEKLKKRFPQAVIFKDQKDPDKLQKDWNAGKIELLFGNLTSISMGLNLQKACKHIATYTLTYDLEVLQQFIGRVWRQGNPASKVTLHMFEAAGTVEERIYPRLCEKDVTQSRLLKALMAEAEEFEGTSCTQLMK